MFGLRRPAVVTLLLAPVLGEWLSTATAPLDMVLWPPALVLLVSLYGCGARCSAGRSLVATV